MRWLTSGYVRDVESDRGAAWVLVRASYTRAVWWAYAALAVVIVLYWIVIKFHHSIFGTEYGPLW
jgi:hypothetical protein